MHLTRLLPRLLLALSLALSPVLTAWQGGMAVAAPVATTERGALSEDGHAQHRAMQQIDGQPDQAQSGCTQHESCLGQCCTGCVHCNVTLVDSPLVASSTLPVLAPHEPQLLTLAYVALRERPPRSLFV